MKSAGQSQTRTDEPTTSFLRMNTISICRTKAINDRIAKEIPELSLPKTSIAEGMSERQPCKQHCDELRLMRKSLSMFFHLGAPRGNARGLTERKLIVHVWRKSGMNEG